MNIDRQTIAATEETIRRHVRTTPVVEITGADAGVDCASVSIKLELMQHAGSFKTRGAFANLLLRDIPAAGVAAASGGNHGAAIAYAANSLGVPAHIFVPEISSPAKIARIREYGADLQVGGNVYADALAACEKFLETSGALEVHAFDQPETLLGQGSVGVEFERQAPTIDTLLVAVGGGGLIGGIAAWYEGRIRIVGVEPSASPTLYNALQAGEPVDAPAGGLAADSLAPARVGVNVFPIAQRFVDHVVTVADDAIAEAQRTLWDKLRLVAEPGGAAAFSALHGGAYVPAAGERVGVLVSGGNTNAVSFDR